MFKSKMEKSEQNCSARLEQCFKWSTSESNWCSLLEMNWLFLGNMKKLYSNGSTFLSSNRFMQTKVRKKVMTGNQPGSQKKKARLD